MNFPPINKADIELAFRCAVARWTGEGLEGDWSANARTTPRLTKENFFLGWIQFWNLKETAKYIPADQFCDFLTNWYRPELLKIENKRADYSLVKRAIEEAIRRRYTRDRQTSLMSKFASSILPTKFSPYDRWAKKGIREKLGQNIADHDYQGFMAVFLEFAEYISKEIRANHPQILALAKKYDMDPDILLWRGTDKLLMLLGGFPRDRMEKEAETVHLP